MHEHTVDTNALVREMAAMRTELSLMRLELAALRDAGETTGAVEPTDVPSMASDRLPPSEVHVTSRRHLFALASGAAAAAAAVAVGSRVSSAAAANGSPIILADNGISDSTNVVTTFLNYTIPTTNTLNKNLFAVGDVSAAFTPDFPAAVSGYAGKTVSTGVSGITSKAGGIGVLGYVVPGTTDSSSIGVHGLSQAGAAVVGESASGIDLFAKGTGRIYMRQFVTVGPPTIGVFAPGEIVRDATPDLWICTVGGAQSKWRKLGGANTAGALHIIDPTRVYDSRIPSFGGPLASNTSRVVNIANGIDLGSGAVTAPNVVPAGATAIQFTLTITEATTNGFLAVTPGDASQYKASTINWTATTSTIATGSLAKIAADRTVNVFAGGGGGTQFIIDITGYYL